MTWTGNTVRRARATWAARLPLPCALGCGRLVDGRTPWVVEHLTPRALGGAVTDPTNQWVSHRACSDRSGGRLAARITNTRRRAARAPEPERLTPETDRRIWGWP